MKKIIRLTESDLARIVKMVIFETSMTKEQVKSSISNFISSCVKNMKELDNIMRASGYSAIAIFLGVCSFLTVEIPGIALMFGASAINFGTQAYKEISGIYSSLKTEEKKSQFKNKCNNVFTCVSNKIENQGLLDLL
jgi:hypothetical protein